MAAPRKYADELRERATRLAVDGRRDPATRSGALKRIGEQLGINPEDVTIWLMPTSSSYARRRNLFAMNVDSRVCQVGFSRGSSTLGVPLPT